MSLKSFSRHSITGKAYPVSSLKYNGDSPDFRRGYAQFDLTVENENGKKCTVSLFVPWKVEKADDTCLKKVSENGGVHFVLGLGQEHLQDIKGEVKAERGGGVRLWPRKMIYTDMDHSLID